MPTIGVVDDRRKERRTLTVALSTALPDNWSYHDSDPLTDLDEYPGWIVENDVVALIIDERLHEQKSDVSATVKQHVTYKGHDLVDYLRLRFPTLPIYVVTSFPKDSSLTDRFKYVEAIIFRDDFLRKVEDWVPRIIRASQQFFEVIQKQLTELAELSLKVATGTASKKEKEKVKALQNSLQAPFAGEQLVDRSDWLNKLQGKISEFDLLQTEIQSFLKERQEGEVEKGTQGKSKATKKR